MKPMLVLLALLMPMSPFAADSTVPSRIEIFTTSAQPIANVAEVQKALGADTAIRYFTLDRQARLDEALSQDLPADPEKARAVALKRIHMLDIAQIKRELSESFEGLVLARRYGLDRYPAVVFDGGRRVVCGVTDLQEALRLYTTESRQ
jgi:integrating conjugative element protein (TIGR03757 family)